MRWIAKILALLFIGTLGAQSFAQDNLNYLLDQPASKMDVTIIRMEIFLKQRDRAVEERLKKDDDEISTITSRVAFNEKTMMIIIGFGATGPNLSMSRCREKAQHFSGPKSPSRRLLNISNKAA